MDVRDASYYIQTMKITKIKVAKWGTPKKIFKKLYKEYGTGQSGQFDLFNSMITLTIITLSGSYCIFKLTLTLFTCI